MSSPTVIDIEAQNAPEIPLLEEEQEIPDNQEEHDTLLERVNERIEELRSYRSICVLCLLSPVLLPILCWLFGCNAVFACILIFCCGVEFPEYSSPYEPPTDPREVMRLRNYFEDNLIFRRVLKVVASDDPPPLDLHSVPSLATLDTTSRVPVTNVVVALTQGVSSSKTKVIFSDQLRREREDGRDLRTGEDRSRASNDTRSVRTVRFDDGSTEIRTIPSRADMLQDYEEKYTEQKKAPRVPTTITTRSPLKGQKRFDYSENSNLLKKTEQTVDSTETIKLINKNEGIVESTGSTQAVKKKEETVHSIEASKLNGDIKEALKSNNSENDTEASRSNPPLLLDDDQNEPKIQNEEITTGKEMQVEETDEPSETSSFIPKNKSILHNRKGILRRHTNLW
eukprot:CAMPEP_0197840958 /NCGR_PEP_ID=MMETSP1437-20131217/45900_1 /TAXON_ID=49252 ORGANISM="Eucampia antarctica, Strain CCMP1452" /NCGR_SAMPLE_ID=MMETSP1437 /ASSEMBLY_ACC=CAM_ASM_001096 /LENGTH=396 /DNA_ID=CAMNT_0043450639 /DNA_START=154 /DNA_END=1341 /DNA_ORIENTATION=-